MELSKKQKKKFRNIFFHFWNLNQILKVLEESMTVIAYVFWELQTAKYVFRWMSKKPRFRTPFPSQHAKGSERLLKSAWQHFHLIFSSIWGKLSWKMSLLVIFQILKLFVKTLAVNDKYSLRNGENLPHPVQIQLSKKQENFSEFFAPFLKSKSIIKIL